MKVTAGIDASQKGAWSEFEGPGLTTASGNDGSLSPAACAIMSESHAEGVFETTVPAG